MDSQERHELIKNIVLARYPYLDSKSDDEYEQKEYKKACDEVHTLCSMTDEQLTQVVLFLAPRLEAQLQEPFRRMVTISQSSHHTTYTTSAISGYTPIIDETIVHMVRKRKQGRI